jgi:hypothetical protein
MLDEGPAFARILRTALDDLEVQAGAVGAAGLLSH